MKNQVQHKGNRLRVDHQSLTYMPKKLGPEHRLNEDPRANKDIKGHEDVIDAP